MKEELFLPTMEANKSVQLAQYYPSATTGKPVYHNRAATYELRAEAPRTRSMMVGGAPKRIAFPQTTVFLTTSSTGLNGVRYSMMNCWACNGPLTMDTPLLISPIHTTKNSNTHVYRNGAVCFGFTVLGEGEEAVRQFWGSNMRIIPDWMSRPVARGSALSAPVVHNTAMSRSRAPSHNHDFEQTPVSEIWTPRTVIPHMMATVRGGVSFAHQSWYEEPNGVTIKAPWLREPMVGEKSDLIKRWATLDPREPAAAIDAAAWTGATPVPASREP